MCAGLLVRAGGTEMTMTHLHPAARAMSASSIAAQTAADLRFADRVRLRNYARSLLEELSERRDHAADVDTRLAIVERIRNLEIEPVTAVRGDLATIEALCAKSCDHMAR
jgi:hypothetical protein